MARPNRVEENTRPGIKYEVGLGNFTSFVITDDDEAFMFQEEQWGGEHIPLGKSAGRIQFLIDNLHQIRKLLPE